MDGLKLIEMARVAGLELAVEGDRLRIRGSKGAAPLAKCLLENKAAVLDEMRFQAHRSVTETETLRISRDQGVSSTTAPGLGPKPPLRQFDWDTTPGIFPTPPIVRAGVRHKAPGCTGRESWQHVWGEHFCMRCWPPTDGIAVAMPAPDPPNRNGVL